MNRQEDWETVCYRYCRDLNGHLVPIDVFKHNGRLVPRFPQDAGEVYLLPEDRESPDYGELVEEICQNLNALEKRRWLLAIHDGRTISQIARMEDVSRQAIICCFRRMTLKNPYVRLWLRNKKNTNQYA